MAEYAGKTVVFQSETDVNEAIRQYEEETVTHFVTSTVMKSYSNSEMKVNRFRWYVNARGDSCVSIPYDRVPFCFVGKKAMTCHMGEDRGKATKKKYHEHKAREEAQGVKKYRQRAPVQTKKSSCVAKISIKKVVKFPEFKLDEGKEQNYDQRLNNKRLLAALNTDSEVVIKQLHYYVKFPAIEDHKDHPMGEEAARKEPIDRRVHAKMKQLADTGVSSYNALQKLIYTYVEKELFQDKPLPPRTRRRYFPSLKDVQNFMTKYKGGSKKSEATPGGKGDVAGSMLPAWDGDEDGGQEDVGGDVVEEGQHQQPPQLASRTEQESFLTLLNAGMADNIHQEVVVSAADADRGQHNTVAHHHQQQMVQDVSGGHQVQVHPVAIHVMQQNDGTPPMHDGMAQMQHHETSQMVQQDETQPMVVHDGMQIGGASMMTSDPISTTPSTNFLSTSVATSSVPSAIHQQQQIVSMSQQQQGFVGQTSQELIPHQANVTAAASGQTKGPRKTGRIGLVCRMKALTHELLDYSLLVKDLPVLEGFVGELESMVEVANQNATLNPIVVQNELARNRRKRQAGPPNFSSKIAHLSDIL